MVTLELVLLIAAAICFLVATFPVPTRINLTALGLFCWVLTLIVR